MSSGIDAAIDLIKTVGGPGAVAALGWWLRTKFSDVKDAGEKRMLSHEHQDERRHRQNLVRFTKIFERMGIEDAIDANGNDDDH